MKVKIINIMTHPPAYNFYKDFSHAKIWWKNNKGKKIGIWGYDWLDVIGENILSQTNKFKYEVWQPDINADKIYSITFESGLIHKLFPAILSKKLYGIKIIKELFSKEIIESINVLLAKEEKIILVLDSNSILKVKKYIDIFNFLPIVLRSGGNIYLPAIDLFSFTKNIPSKINKIYDYLWVKKNINKIDIIIYQNNKYISWLDKIYKNKKYNIFSGCDYSIWQPSNDKNYIREKLNLPIDRNIFLVASFFKKLKQIDKLISVFIELSSKFNFLLIIAGHGDNSYEEYLHNLAKPLINNNKCKFIGYIRGGELIDYYNSSDYFLLTSTEEGASNSVLQAFACELPVISTKVGGTAELMEELNFGCLLDIYDYQQWKGTIKQILSQKLHVSTIEREKIEPYGSLKSVAKQYIRVFEELEKQAI